jgi:hypothetical protein
MGTGIDMGMTDMEAERDVNIDNRHGKSSTSFLVLFFHQTAQSGPSGHSQALIGIFKYLFAKLLKCKREAVFLTTLMLYS